MARRNKARSGQLSIIAALLVAIILVSSVIITYSVIRNSQIQDSPYAMSAVDEVNFAIKQILGFSVGYYGSVLQVTGNYTYAKQLAQDYLQSGFENIANMHPDWGPSFNLEAFNVKTYWYTRSSYSHGSVGVSYNLTGIGVHGINYNASCQLETEIIDVSNNQTRMKILRDEDSSSLTLARENFRFFSYNYDESVWELVHPYLEPLVFINGTYVIDIPIPEVDADSFMIQVSDQRGIMTVASSFSRYTHTLSWNQTLYSTLQDDTMVVEFLQNGTMRWLGQNLQLTTKAIPVPPIPVKSFHVNQTINGVNQEVPFQIEAWASDYRVPLGLSSSASVFSNRHMIVTLIKHNVEKISVWWDGNDDASQTSLACTNKYFVDRPQSGILSNGRLTLYLYSNGTLKSVSGASAVYADFMRINTKRPTYGSGAAYVIYNGTVRDIFQQEAEWSGGIPNCPNVYSHLVITLPANATYYTYSLRTIFVSSAQSRTITDLSPIQLRVTCAQSAWGGGWGQTLAENGTSSGAPNSVSIASQTVLLRNFTDTSTRWMHHWAEFLKNGKGGGIMFTDASNRLLYALDRVAGNKAGALKVVDSRVSTVQTTTIEFNPVSAYSASFQYALELGWHGAVVTFDNTNPIYVENAGVKTGLWIMVEHPPTIAVSTEN